ncbi:lipase [Colletotrichum graminicola M1.001]|uniref:Lipase n=1 Tax=Colletotrichum graminicola (strain M1.001 / M2 / FGSC 10212) TaxID=645133 RepID=E3QT98_COLGM|nr:lipase [Colletotrichum graminicola M1.001]EFQ34086.1 lipase [Colletotrichum graminicola M1.001]
MAFNSSPLTQLHRDLAHANLERLSLHELPEAPVQDPDFISIPEKCDVAFNLLKKWSVQNKASIEASIASQAFGGKAAISWSRAFLPFMESMAMYLRDYSKLRKAWKTYCDLKAKGPLRNADLETCIVQYHAAYSPIRELAQSWGMDFVVLCDLIHSPPHGHVAWDGPYCGAFFSTDTQKAKPFVGVAFKGTNPLSLRDIDVDYNYQLTDSGRYLGGTRVSLGVFTALFDKFESIEDTAYDFITTALGNCVMKMSKAPDSVVRAHVTGHSLGGSYSSFFYAQQLQDDGVPDVRMATGDEYTFGAPRVGGQPWAVHNDSVVSESEGQSWRIVNSQDLVPQVPPTSLRPTELEFCHIDKGVKIFGNQLPEPIKSEIGGPPPPVINFENPCALVRAVYDSTYHRKSPCKCL